MEAYLAKMKSCGQRLSGSFRCGLNNQRPQEWQPQMVDIDNGKRRASKRKVGYRDGDKVDLWRGEGPKAYQARMREMLKENAGRTQREDSEQKRAELP